MFVSIGWVQVLAVAVPDPVFIVETKDDGAFEYVVVYTNDVDTKEHGVVEFGSVGVGLFLCATNLYDAPNLCRCLEVKEDPAWCGGLGVRLCRRWSLPPCH